MVNHYGVGGFIHQHRLRSCLCVHNKAARGPAENSGATNLHCLHWSSDERGKKREEKNNTENRKTGQDADICKRSDTDLEKASSSGWLVNRGVKLPCGSQSMGKSQAHWLNLYISVVNVYCSLKPGDYWNIFFYVLLFQLFFFNGGSKSIWIWGHEDWTQLQSGIYRSYKTVPGSPGECPSTPLVSLLCPIALCSSWKPLWHHTKLKIILLCKCFAFIEPEMHFCMKL